MGGNMSLRDCSNSQKDQPELMADQYELTEKEKELVRTTWAVLSEHKDTISVDIFMRIFELIPQAKEFFPFKNAVGEALMEHPYLKGHAMRFFHAIGMTVLNLDAWQVILIPNLLRLGKQHINIQGFKHEYFQSFARAMNDVFKKHLGRAYTKETRIAWNKISSLITSTVEQGYREGQDTRRVSQQLPITTEDQESTSKSEGTEHHNNIAIHNTGNSI